MMPTDLSDADWLEVYAYLLERLGEDRFSELRREIESAASAAVVNEPNMTDSTQAGQKSRRKRGHRTLRTRSAPEAFEAAVEVLRSRLVERPAVAQCHRALPWQRGGGSRRNSRGSLRHPRPFADAACELQVA